MGVRDNKGDTQERKGGRERERNRERRSVRETNIDKENML